MAAVDVPKRKLFFKVGHLSSVFVGKNNAATRVVEAAVQVQIILVAASTWGQVVFLVAESDVVVLVT